MRGGGLFRAGGFGSLTDLAAAASKRRADAIRLRACRAVLGENRLPAPPPR